MRSWSVAIAFVVVGTVVGCAHAPATPAAAPATAQRPGGEGGRGGEGARPPQGVATVRRAPAPPNWERQDSVRKALMAEVLATVAGRENEPAGTVFKNVKFSKNMPVKDFLVMMDEQYGRSVGATCTGGHANTNVGGVLKVDYADDSPKKKQISRLMEQMTQTINKELSKNKGLDQPYIRSTCVMCHRGTEHMPTTMKQLKNSDPPPQTRQKG